LTAPWPPQAPVGGDSASSRGPGLMKAPGNLRRTASLTLRVPLGLRWMPSKKSLAEQPQVAALLKSAKENR